MVQLQTPQKSMKSCSQNNYVSLKGCYPLAKVMGDVEMLAQLMTQQHLSWCIFPLDKFYPIGLPQTVQNKGLFTYMLSIHRVNSLCRVFGGFNEKPSKKRGRTSSAQKRTKPHNCAHGRTLKKSTFWNWVICFFSCCFWNVQEF